LSNAPSPPAQTPVLFLKGGAADRFSDECKALLAKAGYDPASFGSYDHCAKQIRGAKDQCSKYDEAVNAGKPPPVPQPTAQQRHLASCQSGHLTQNAVYQNDRGNPCSNVDSAPGHADNLFPCMPQAGHAMQQGGEHQLATVHEQNSAAGPNGDRKAGDPYPADQIGADSDDRGRKVADDADLAKRNNRQPTAAAGGAEGGGAGASAQSGGTAGDAAGPNAGQPSQPNEPWNQPLTGKTAGDCINSFRKAGEAAMRQKCQDDRERNRARANGGKNKSEEDGKAYRQKLAKEAEDAKKAAALDPDNEAKQKSATRAQTRSSVAERAKCKADQGDYLAGQPPPDNRYKGPPYDGVVPRNVAPPASGDNGTVAEGQV
jgi:hypothetical protein